MSAEAFLPDPRTGHGTVRRTLLLVAVAALPFTYALTLNVRFPLKIYEVAIALLLLTYLLELRLPAAPGSAVLVRRLAWFTLAAAGLSLVRVVLPAEGASTGDFGVRFGPAGDAVAKLLYLTLGVFGFLLFAWAAYANERGFLRAWRFGAVLAAAYSWYLFVAAVVGLPMLLLPGIEDPKYFTVAGVSFIRSGTFQEGNFMGLFLLVSIGLALYERRHWLAVFFSLTLLLTFSTVNLFALALLWVLLLIRGGSGISVRRRAAYVAVGVLAAVVVGVILFQTGYIESVVVGKLSTEELGSRLKRIAFVVAGLRMFADHPLAGIGISQFGYFYNTYQPLGVLGVAETVKLIPNNIYVELLAELGIIGFLLFVTFLLAIYRRLRHPSLRPLRLTFIAVLFSFNAFPTYTVMFLWAFFGLAAGASARIASSPAAT